MISYSYERIILFPSAKLYSFEESLRIIMSKLKKLATRTYYTKYTLISNSLSRILITHIFLQILISLYYLHVVLLYQNQYQMDFHYHHHY